MQAALLRAVGGDYDNDGFLDLFVLSYTNKSSLYHNRGNGTFESVDVGSPLVDGTRRLFALWADYDNDGFLDLFLACSDAVPNLNQLYHNNALANGSTNRWLKVKLTGTVSNRDGIGAKVRLRAIIGGRSFWQMREVSGNSPQGGGQPLTAHFGLGDAAVVDTVRIEWPSGIVQELHDVAAKQILRIVEPPVLAAISPGRVLVRGAKDINYAIEVSSDLKAWAKSGVVKGSEEFIDAEAGQHAARFYRAVAP